MTLLFISWRFAIYSRLQTNSSSESWWRSPSWPALLSLLSCEQAAAAFCRICVWLLTAYRHFRFRFSDVWWRQRECLCAVYFSSNIHCSWKAQITLVLIFQVELFDLSISPISQELFLVSHYLLITSLNPPHYQTHDNNVTLPTCSAGIPLDTGAALTPYWQHFCIWFNGSKTLIKTCPFKLRDLVNIWAVKA